MTARIAVTGANGFLGSEICAALKDFHVSALVRRNADAARLKKIAPHAEINLLDDDWDNTAEVLTAIKPDVIIHAAAAMDAGDDVAAAKNLVTVNILQPAMLLAAAKAAGCKGFITVGTAWQHYGNADFDPVNLYAASKQAFDDILRAYAAGGMATASLHLYDSYGNHDPRPKLVNLLFKLARTGEALDMSPGDQEIDLIHAEDAARAFVMMTQQILSGQHIGFEYFAVSGGNPLPLRQLAAMAAEISGKKINIHWGVREYRPREVMQTWRGGRVVPGWQPQIALRDGLQRIWQEQNS